MTFPTRPTGDELEMFKWQVYANSQANEAIDEYSRRTVAGHVAAIRSSLWSLKDNFRKCTPGPDVYPENWNAAGVAYHTSRQHHHCGYIMFILDVVVQMVNEDFDVTSDRFADVEISEEELETALTLMVTATGADLVEAAKTVRTFVCDMLQKWNDMVPQNFIDGDARQRLSVVCSLFSGTWESWQAQYPNTYPQLYY